MTTPDTSELYQKVTSILLAFGADYSNASNANDITWKAEALSEARLPLLALLAAQRQRWEAEAILLGAYAEVQYIDTKWPPEKWKKRRLAELEQSVKALREEIAALDGVIGEPLGSSPTPVDASAQGHEADNRSEVEPK